MTKLSFSTIALVGTLAALAATGCGSSDDGKPIPATVRQQLEVQLDEAEARLGDGSPGACADITNETEPDVDRILDRVPDDVDPDVRDALNEGFARLFELVSNRCDELKSGQTDTETVTTEETRPQDTATTEERTTPTETTDTETTPQQPTSPDTDTGNGNGNGKGNGNAGGGAGDSVQVPDDDGGATPPGQ